MSSIKNVALAGSSGSLGKLVLEKFVASGEFNITVLRRLGSSATFDSGVNVVDVDYESVDSLTSTLKDQDALISTVGSMHVGGQRTLIDASIAAGVTRFIPSEFGSNLDNPTARRLPVFTYKVQIQDYLIEKAQTTGLSHTFVYNNAFLDWGLEYNFIFKHSSYKPVIIDGGNDVFSSTSLASVADAVVGIVKHPEETKNRAVYIEDIKISQNQLLALAKKAAPEKPWAPENVKLDDLVATADCRLAQGAVDFETFRPYLLRACMDPVCDNNFQKTDNDLLGVKARTEADVVELLKKYIK